MLTAAQVKRAAREAGADIVGIGSTDRFEGAPRQMDPRFMLPTARSVVAMGFRHARGCFRGIEEGTFFTAYSAMGYSSINYIYQPYVLQQVGRLIEDEGYDVLPIPNNFPWNNINVSGTQSPEETVKPNLGKSRPASPGKPAPDAFIQLRLACFVAGLGEIGFSKLLLTPEFGPRQRVAVLLTDAELEADPVLEPGTICDRCLACVRACTGGCFSTERTVKVTVAGKQLEWSDIDMRKCGTFFCGGSPENNPFATTAQDRAEFGKDVGTAQQHKVPPVYVYSRALEGASGCIRACMLHLEQTGRIRSQFHSRFRKRPQWRLNLEAPPGPA
jgi:hypothetical protein